MTPAEAKRVIKQFWDLPKVQHGQSQVPYFYDKAALDKLNEATEVLVKKMVNWQELRKKLKLVPRPPEKRVQMRAEKRNKAREAKLAGKIAANFQPKKSRSKQEPVVHELPPKREPKTRGKDGKFSKSPHAPSYVSTAGYKSRQKRSAQEFKVFEAGATAKSRRANRQSASKARKAMEAKKSRAKANREG